MVDIVIRRVYDDLDPGEGARVLVDRLWPRGVKKDALGLTAWCKDIAPSENLRRWFNHEPDKWPMFRTYYWQELENNRAQAEALLALSSGGRLTLLYGAKNREHNHARVLLEYLNTLSPHR